MIKNTFDHYYYYYLLFFLIMGYNLHLLFKISTGFLWVLIYGLYLWQHERHYS